MKKAVFSDFDGTLAAGYAAFGFMRTLSDRGIYPAKIADTQDKILEDMVKNTIDYQDGLTEMSNLWAEGLKGQKTDRVEYEAREYYKKAQAKIYKGSRDAMSYLKYRGYHEVLVTAAQYEIAKLEAKDLGMDDVIATRCETMDDIYTGRLASEVHLPTGKGDALKKYIAENDIDTEKTIAMGDTLQDASMLEVVKCPIALNPQKELEEYAKQKGWEIRTHLDIVNFLKKI